MLKIDMKKIKFTNLDNDKLIRLSSRFKAGPEDSFKSNKKWSDNFRKKSRSKRIIFASGANTVKIDRLKEVRIKFVLHG